MTDSKFDPMKEIAALRSNISRAVEQGIKSISNRSYFPAVDIYETDTAVIVQTEPMIGLKPDSIEVSMENDVLTLRGATEADDNIPENTYILRELTFGGFERQLTINRPVHANQARARLKMGMLIVTLPKALEADDESQIISVTPISSS